MSAHRTGYVTHHDCSRHDTGWRHPEHQGRLPAVARAVHRDMLTLFDHLLEIEGVPATAEELAVAHSTAYIDRVARRCREAASAEAVLPLEDDVVVSGASWDAALAAAGCVITAVDRVHRGEIRNAFCAVRPPGHGAAREHGGAFGIFNGVAVATLHLLRAGGAGSVWVVDIGARPGAGTVDILQDETGARMFMLHSASTDVELPATSNLVARAVAPGATGDGLLSELTALLDAAERAGPPGFILLSLGCDALLDDPLGDLALRPDDYHGLTRVLTERADRLCSGRLVGVLEEGYDAPATATAVVQHVRALAGLPLLEQ